MHSKRIPEEPSPTPLVEGVIPKPPTYVWWGPDRVPEGFDPRWIEEGVEPIWITEEDKDKLFTSCWKPFKEVPLETEKEDDPL